MVIRYDKLGKGQKANVRGKLNKQKKEQAEFDAETERLIRKAKHLLKQSR